MKNKLLKNIKFISLIIVFGLVFLPKTVLADEDHRCTYSNYYFFSEINQASWYQKEELYDSKSGIYLRNHQTFLPALEGANIAVIANATGQVCLSKDGSVGNCEGVETMTLEKFYDTYKQVYNKNNKKTFNYTDTNGNPQTAYYYRHDNQNKRFFEHTTWYKVEDGTPIKGGDEPVDISSVSTENLAKGSMLADSVTVTHGIEKDITNFSINRKIKKSNLDGVTAFHLTGWGPTILTPSMYKITYTSDCYQAIIRYYKIEDNGAKTEITSFEDGSQTPFSSSFPDQYEGTVKSPSLQGCKPDKSTVTIKIDGKDFEDEVIYTCQKENDNTSDEEIVNVPTGNAMVYLTWILAIASLGCVTYFFIKNNKETE